MSNIQNGLLPAAFSFGVATTQEGFDLAAHLGLYPGIAANDSGTPNVGPLVNPRNTALSTTGLDIRQVYMTFGNKELGTFTLGRNIGLFGADVILNDMTLPGVGVAGSASGAAPANTTLGSIGLGYIYTDWLFYGSATFISQKQEYINGAGAAYDYNGTGFDVFAKIDVEDLEAFAYYYHGSGLGTTGLFILSDDGSGNTRDSDGFLVQATYKVGAVKFGVNYGESKLDLANGEVSPTLVAKNRKVTGGIYDSLTKNLTLLAEVSDVHADAHNGNSDHSTNFNIGAFLSF
ncbi:MAG: hypothetical protein E6K34_10300 [Gammaproteobacteria bacterium]|nr:MAG: hypothetical protein E6K34_10300 [Gammaproteobacteria bacterium]